MEESEPENDSFSVSSELFFLIHKFLSNGPLQNTYEALTKELEQHKILPKRLDWTGKQHERKISDMETHYSNVFPDYLLQLCTQIEKKVNSNIPLYNKKLSLLSLNSSLNDKKEHEHNFRQIQRYITRIHGVPIRKKTMPCNIVNMVRGRELAEPLAKGLVIMPKIYNSLRLQRLTLGHLSAVYCLLFDHSGRYIMTGADDLLIKLWSATTGRLITSFRGANSEITDITVNLENTLLASGSIDRVLRVWNMQTGVPIAVLTGHTGMITSVNFCPSPCWGLNYLISTSTDGSVAFWSHTTDVITGKVQFRCNPILYQERMRPGQAQMICSSFSPGGTFLATGSADHNVRVYYMKGDEGPQRILEMEAHSDRVDSIQWAHSGLKFLSGSKDGLAIIWHFETQQWKNRYLYMTAKLPKEQPKKEQSKQDQSKKLKVTMVAWDYSDTWVITAVSDYTLKIWRAESGQLEKVLTGHTDEVYVLEPHPHLSGIILSAGHDGQLMVWDLEKGESVAKFLNSIEGQGKGAIFDGKWSPDGLMIAVSDSHGHILMYGFGTGNALLQELPKELFFHTDYRPLVRDANQYVLDEQTQVPPHLMPPPFLVDMDGNPYPPSMQKLVPGREQCQMEQLIPNIVFSNEGRQEVIQGVDQPRSDIDRMIAFLAQNQENAENQEQEEGRNPGLYRSTSRRNGEGIRQSTGEWQRDPNIKWKRHVLVQPLRLSELKTAKKYLQAIERFEIDEYHKELCRRPHMISSTSATNEHLLRLNEKKKRQAAYRTRRNQLAAQTDSHHSEATESEDNENNDDSDFSESSGYSDWVAEEGVNLEPPKRSKRRQVNQNSVSYVSEEENENVQEEKKKPPPPPPPPRKDLGKYKLNNGEIPEAYKISEWLSETKPKKIPYYPQMGDEGVYFLQGHQLYVSAVRSKKVYDVNLKDLPWIKLKLRDHEFVKVVGIRYEIKPPRICCLKLAILDEEGRLTGKIFTVKYHDMPDVLDFFVLKQQYETAISRNWTAGNKFRSMIDDCWWIGEILSHSPLSEEHPQSLFICYEVKWENEEVERMSPWDLEPIDESRRPENDSDSVPVLKEEMQQILYQPCSEDWPNTDRDFACKNILQGLLKVMELSIAEPFLVPVDLNAYPLYAYVVEYPIDISTIKSRFENNFYRRITSAQFDIRYLATNAEKFNERHSVIVKNARILTELCLRIIKHCSTVLDVPHVYHQLVDAYDSSDTEADIDITTPSTSGSRTLRNLSNRNLISASEWKAEARTLLEAIWDSEDSVPFQSPVNIIKYPDYHRMINNPMDLTTVKDNLISDKYKTPLHFCRDMRLIFKNSRTYNTNKRSRIYVMTVRLSAIFEEHIKKITENWLQVRKKNNHKRKMNNNKSSTSDSSDSSSSSSDDENSSDSLLDQNNKITSEHSSSSNSDDDKPLQQLARIQTSNFDSDSMAGTSKNSNSNLSRKKFEDVSVSESLKDTLSNSNSTVDNIENSNDSTILPAQKSTKQNVKIKHIIETDSNEESELPNTNLVEFVNCENIELLEDSFQPTTSKKSEETQESDDESYSEESSDSRFAQRKSRRKRIRTKNSSSEFTLSNESDSDEPLSNHIKKAKNRRPKRLCNNNKISHKNEIESLSELNDDEDDDDDDDLDENDMNSSTSSYNNNNNNRRNIRRKCVLNSPSVRRHNKRFKEDDEDDSETERHFTSISSRGRVRKLTPRAMALMKK